VSGALLEAVRRLDAAPGVAAIVITGRGKAFAAGADIKELARLGSPEQVGRWGEGGRRGREGFGLGQAGGRH
jgi:enoyl-CoA hydratase/carnithine racemase